MNINLLISNFLRYFMRFFECVQLKCHNMRKTIFFLFAFVGIFGVAVGQQDPQFTQYMHNIYFYNPGFAGANDAICATGLFRQQWLGFTETVNGKENNVAPQTMLFTIDAAIHPLRGGIGLVVYKDKLGYEENTGVKIGYAYKMPFKGGNLGIGFHVNLLNKQINYSQFVAIDPDPLIMGDKKSDMLIDGAFGIYYSQPGVFWAGVSANQILQAKSDMGTSVSGTSLASPELKRHFYFSGGYQYQLNADIDLRPTALIKTDFVSAQYDFDLLAYYKNQFWGGLGYRHTDAIAISIGCQPALNSGSGLSPLKVGYSYDFTTSALGRNGISSGSHEIFLNYCFKIIIVVPPSSYKNVRFL